jgi:hypothetical protein
VAQAKVALLMLGDQAEAERRARGPVLRKYSVLISLAAAVAGIAIPLLGRFRRKEPRPAFSPRGRAAGVGLSLGLILKLLRPALPLIVRFVAQRRAVAQARRGVRTARSPAHA